MAVALSWHLHDSGPASAADRTAGGAAGSETASPEPPAVEPLPPPTVFAPSDPFALPPEAIPSPTLAPQIPSDAVQPFLVPHWDNGFICSSPDGAFSLRVGGRVQVDTGFFGESPDLANTPIADGGVGPIRNSTELRRARIRLEGLMWSWIGWAAEVDFATMANASNIPGNPPGFPGSAQGPPNQGPLVVSPSLTDLYVTFVGLPVGNFRIGNGKEPIGLEHITSSRWLDFMERSYNQDAFYGPFNGGFTPGMMLFGWAGDGSGTWALWGGPNNTNPFGFHIGDEYATTGRITLLPYYDLPTQGRYLFHLGASGSVRRPDQHQLEVRARGDIRSGPPSTANPIYADTGSFAASCQEMANVEALAISGPWQVQAEYLASFVQNARQNPLATSLPPAQFNLPPATAVGNSVFFQGTYVELLYFLTGESRPYDRRAGVVTRVIPNQNFFWVRTPRGGAVGWGAFQIGARYSFLDLNSGGINGGNLNSMTLGLNWFWNPNMKLQFNYDYTRRGAVGLAGPGNINSGGIRVAIDF